MRNGNGAANISLVQSLYDAFGRGETAFIIAALAPDVDWRLTGREADYPLFGNRKGPRGVQDFFTDVAALGIVKEFSPREFVAAEDRVFVLGHYAWTIRKTGREVASDWIHVFTVRDGKVTDFREFTDTAQFAAAYRT